jgi:hypothetical protein
MEKTIQSPIVGNISYKYYGCNRSAVITVENESTIYKMKFQRDFLAIEESCACCLLCAIPWCTCMCIYSFCYHCYHAVSVNCCGGKVHISQLESYDYTDHIRSIDKKENGITLRLYNYQTKQCTKIYNIVLPEAPASQVMS